MFNSNLLFLLFLIIPSFIFGEAPPFNLEDGGVQKTTKDYSKEF